MKNITRLVLILFILLGCIGCDQATKAIAEKHLPRNEVLSFANDTFRLQYAENKGAFLSLGASLSEETRTVVFTIGNSIVLAAIFGYIIFSRSLPGISVIALSLILAGGFSNIIDRVVNDGYVIDFINIGIGDLRTGIFNVADVYIMLGGFLIIISSLPIKKQRERF